MVVLVLCISLYLDVQEEVIDIAEFHLLIDTDVNSVVVVVQITVSSANSAEAPGTRDSGDQTMMCMENNVGNFVCSGVGK